MLRRPRYQREAGKVQVQHIFMSDFISNLGDFYREILTPGGFHPIRCSFCFHQ